MLCVTVNLKEPIKQLKYVMVAWKMLVLHYLLTAQYTNIRCVIVLVTAQVEMMN